MKPTLVVTLVITMAASLLSFSTVFAETNAELAAQVRNAENAFAKTMADRDLKAFESFVADDAFFFGQKGLRGKKAVVEAWKGFYEGREAPFSWRAETVEVLDTGQLAYSSGPVFDPQGKRTATFNSVWRREPDGRWKVVFDKGTCVCGDPKSN
jgi:ketosteroid isomerase-like protein